MNTVIIGGGMAGLTAAYKLSQKGVKVTLLEKETKVGGRIPYCGAVTTKSFQPRLNKLIKELGLEILKVPIKHQDEAFYTSEGKIVGFESFISLLRKEIGLIGIPSFIKAAKFVDSIDFDPLNPDERLKKYKEISFADYLEKECPGRASDFIKELSSLFIFEKDFSKISAEYGLCHFRWGNELSSGQATGFEENNLEIVTNTLKKEANKSGEFIVSAKVTSVKKEGDNFKVCYSKDGKKSEIEAEKVVMATPLDVTKEIFPDIDIETDVWYAKSKCYFVEGKLKWPDRKFIIGLRENDANVRAIFAMLPYMHLVYPQDSEKSVNFEEFYSNYKIIREKDLSHAFSVFPPKCKIPDIKTSIEGLFLCGDFYIYPTLEAAVLSGEKAASYILENN